MQIKIYEPFIISGPRFPVPIFASRFLNPDPVQVLGKFGLSGKFGPPVLSIAEDKILLECPTNF